MDEKKEAQSPQAKAQGEGKAQTEEENLSIYEKSLKLRDELRAENDRREKILQEEQRLESEKLLSSSAGMRQEKQNIPQEQSSKDYANDVLAGKVKAQ